MAWHGTQKGSELAAEVLLPAALELAVERHQSVTIDCPDLIVGQRAKCHVRPTLRRGLPTVGNCEVIAHDGEHSASSSHARWFTNPALPATALILGCDLRRAPSTISPSSLGFWRSLERLRFSKLPCTRARIEAGERRRVGLGVQVGRPKG